MDPLLRHVLPYNHDVAPHSMRLLLRQKLEESRGKGQQATTF